jgi:pimeloyl-ACP methyl ester carboxylesterase
MYDERIGLSSHLICGASMGARNAMVFAHIYPQKLKTLTIMTWANGDPLVYDYYQKMFAAIPNAFQSDEVKISLPTASKLARAATRHRLFRTQHR